MLSLGDTAFWGCSLTNLTIGTLPDTATSIGGSAFELCAGLTSVTIPESITNIGTRAFLSCFNLTNISIPSKLATIGGAATAFSAYETASGPFRTAESLRYHSVNSFFHCTTWSVLPIAS